MIFIIKIKKNLFPFLKSPRRKQYFLMPLNRSQLQLIHAKNLYYFIVICGKGLSKFNKLSLNFQTISQHVSTNYKMSSQIVNICYPIENFLKLIFIPMGVFNMNGAVIVATIVTLMALLRVVKRPSFSKQYAQKVLLNNHGQNLMYLGAGAMGNVNFLYYAPLILFFAFGIAEYINQKYHSTKYSAKYMPYITMIRNQKFYIMEGKAKLQVVYLIFLILTLPLGFMSRLMKVIILGQYVLMKFRISNEFRYGCSEIHKFVDSKTKSVGFINSIYNKIINYAYSVATADPRQQQQQ